MYEASGDTRGTSLISFRAPEMDLDGVLAAQHIATVNEC
jgi:hypothetical protein